MRHGQSRRKGRFAADLLAWYEHNRRDLPWRRREQDPYAVWVSEIMLQQTTVAAVIPFYERWMARFPTVQSLAEAPLDDVLKHWAGLGYYARARNLHRGAQEVLARHGGQLPSDPASLLALPGIGRYTAGAIRSIAFNQDAPILDANVIRVLSRIHAVPGDPKAAATQAELWRLAEEAIPQGQAGDFNQAMMELGALVCSPAAPRCASCPVAADCAARASGDPTAYPQFQNVKKWLAIEDASIAIRDSRGHLLLAQRSPESPLWGGLWELPRATRQEGEPLAQCARRAACETVGLTLGAMTPFGTVKHVVANRRVTLHGYTAQAPPDAAPSPVGCSRLAWVAPEDISRYALATPQVRLLQALAHKAVQGRLDLEDL